MGGPDHVCSDGYCYPNATACPSGTSRLSNVTCKCLSGSAFPCYSGGISTLQVYAFWKLFGFDFW
jgi:hypothetical protein